MVAYSGSTYVMPDRTEAERKKYQQKKQASENTRLERILKSRNLTLKELDEIVAKKKKARKVDEEQSKWVPPIVLFRTLIVVITKSPV